MQASTLLFEKKGVIESHEGIVEELHEKLQTSEQSTTSFKKKIAELKTKCGGLLEKYEEERRQR